MTFIFDEVTNPDLIRRERRTRQILIGAVVAILLGGFLYYQFKNYPQEREVKRFLQALQREDYKNAYEIWKPSPSYPFKDFERDWGPKGEYGKVQNFKVVTSHARGSIVDVATTINGKEFHFWVRRSDRSLSFPAF